MDNRSLILDRSLELFSRQGYDAVGVQEIAQASGLTKPTLYHYFGSKQGLLQAIFENDLPRLIEGLEKDCEYRRDLVMNLRRSCVRLFDEGARSPGLMRLILSSAYAPPDSELARTAAPWNARISWVFEELFRSAEKDNGNMKGRSALHSASFLGTVFTYVSLSLASKVKADEGLSRRLVQTFMHGIFS